LVLPSHIVYINNVSILCRPTSTSISGGQKQKSVFKKHPSAVDISKRNKMISLINKIKNIYVFLNCAQFQESSPM